MSFENYIDQITKDLWAHQVEIVWNCKDRNHYALLMEMGTGKTLAAISVFRLWCVLNQSMPRALVLCPSIPLVFQWVSEFEKWSKLGPKCVPLVGSGEHRLSTLNSTLDKPCIYITNYRSLLMDPLFAALQKTVFGVGIFDESHVLKNHKAKQTKKAIILADKMKKKLILTGTPFLNSPMDLYSQFRVLDGGAAFGKNFYSFLGQYFYDAMAFKKKDPDYFPKWIPRLSLRTKLVEVLQKNAYRKKKTECLDLPPFIRKTVPVILSGEQRTVYKDLKKKFIHYLDGGEGVVEVDMVITQMIRLQQIVSGFVPVTATDFENVDEIFKKTHKEKNF